VLVVRVVNTEFVCVRERERRGREGGGGGVHVSDGEGVRER